MQLKRTITIEIEAEVGAINNHEQLGDLERRFLEDQLATPLKDALRVFHRTALTEVFIHTDLVRR